MDHLTKSQLAQLLKAARIWRDLNKSKAARRAGIDRYALLRIENGTREASFREVVRLVDVYDLKMTTLTGSKNTWRHREPRAHGEPPVGAQTTKQRELLDKIVERDFKLWWKVRRRR